MTMPFIFDDGGRSAAGFKGRCGDCVTRSVAIATGIPYAEVYAALSDVNAGARTRTRSAGRRTARSGVSVRSAGFKRYMESLGWRWNPTMRVGSGCKIHLVPGELPTGRLIVSVSKHYTAVIDGVIHDTFNPSDRAATFYPPHAQAHEVPKGAIRREDDGWWIYKPQRCVYGYWQQISVS